MWLVLPPGGEKTEQCFSTCFKTHLNLGVKKSVEIKESFEHVSPHPLQFYSFAWGYVHV